jgi:hypothetical protein
VRVVCAFGVTMATFSPISALSSVDLPALGRPRIDTNPDFTKSLAASALLEIGTRQGQRIAYDPGIVWSKVSNRAP